MKRTTTIEGPEMPKRSYKQSYNSSDTCQLLGLVALREQRALAQHARGGGSQPTSRAGKQLASMGKLLVGQRKLRASVPDAFKDMVPEGHSFTCVSVFESLLRGEFNPLYGEDGRYMRAMTPDASD